MLNNIRKVSYADIIFYFLTISIFIVFLMPFMHYHSIYLVPKKASDGTIRVVNDIATGNNSLFVYRYNIFYATICISSVAILINKKLFSQVINLFKSFNKTLQYAIALFFIFGIVSSSFAISPSIAFKGVSITFLQFFCVLFIAIYVRNNYKAIRFFYVVILLSLLFFGGTLFLNLFFARYSKYGIDVAETIQSILLFLYNCINPRFLDNYFSWFMPLLFLPWLIDLRPIYKIGSFIALTLSWFVLINHGFRTIFIEYTIILFLLFIFARKYFKTILLIFVLTLFCSYLLQLFYNEFIAVSSNYKGQFADHGMIRGGSSGRIPLWKEAFFVGLEHPLTGIGQWNYIAVTKRPDGYPHNLLLEIWSQWGIPAFVSAFVVILTAVKNLYKKRLEICSNPYHCTFVMMLVAGMIDGMINAMFKTSLGLFGCVFVFGFCLSIFVKQNNQSNCNVSGISYVFVGLIIALCLFCVYILPLIFPPLWI